MKAPIIIFATLLAAAVAPLRAQVVADGATSTLSNVTNTFTGDVTVGTNGSFTLLVLSNNTLLTNSINGLIGRNATAKSNEVQLLSTSARWRMGGSLFVGSNGAASRLIVGNGALVENFNGTLGSRLESSNNAALVTGSGSRWSNRLDLAVGFSGPGNQLVLSNGALVVNRIGNIGQQPGSSNNLVVVTGNGSYWSNQFDVNVGVDERGNRLVIEAGGLVNCDNGRVGAGAFGSGNEALVTGPGSLWSSRSDLAVGLNAANNRLVVSNGAAVVASGNGRVGVSTPATGNQVLVTGAGSLWSSQLELQVGEASAGNRLEVNSGGWVVNSNAYVGNGGSSNLALVTGNGSIWSNRNDLVVGNFSVGNRLVVNGGAEVVAGRDVLIGANSGSASNSIFLSDAGTRWAVSSNLNLGNTGSVSQLIISNGALALSRDTTVGFNFFSTNNLILVTGPGSRWSNSGNMYLGFSGTGNRLIVSNGAVARTSSGEVGQSSISFSNAITVSGPGSSFDSGLLVIGQVGDRNRLVIEDGGQVSSGFAVAGQNTGARFNDLQVSGAGSTWKNDILIVGARSQGNQLTITNGGEVLGGYFNNFVNEQGVFLGTEPGSTNNRVVINGGTLRATNVPGTAVLDVSRGTNVLNAGLIEADHLRLTNAQGFFEFNGGTLVTRGAVINNHSIFTVGNAGNIPAVWEIRPGASNHFVAGDVAVGGGGSFAQLIHTNGALLTNGGFAALGFLNSSRSNSAILAGPASRWWLGDGLLVGDGGSDNHLVVRDGASLVTASITYMGNEITSTNNEAVVTGPGSSWFTADYGLRVGNQGRNNRLLVSDGGVVSSFDDMIGVNPSSSNNQVLVTGSGSLWNNTRELSAGLNSIGNQLVVSNGATVFTVANKYVGQNAGALSNTAIVTDPGSAWLGDDSLYVGLDGSFNRLFVRNGGRVTSGIASLGGSFGANGNQALITDASSVWSNRLDLNVGDGGSANQLVLSNSGTIVSASNGFIGRNNGANSNAAILTGIGTRWLLSSNFNVGSNGAFNRLVISNSARMENGLGSIGTGFSGSNNLAVVTGSGSVWSNASELFIGLDGRGNQLVVSNGASVASGIAFIGRDTNAILNSVVVTDPGTRWLIDSEFYAGSNGALGLLVISNAALVLNSNAWLGFSATSRSNVAVVTGAGTIWSNRQALTVGNSGSGNRLVLSGGARIDGRSGTLGALTSGSNNEVVVTGPGSLWRMEQDLTIGGLGNGNRLVITNGGAVRNSGGTIGSLTSSSNEVVVTGPGSSWTSPSSTMFIGNVGNACRLVVTNGGAVIQESSGVVFGNSASSTNNRIEVDGGSLLMTNPISGTFDVRRGTAVFNSGVIAVTQLLLTNDQGFLDFNGGTFSANNSRVSNGTIFRVGNGVSPATFILASNSSAINGVHEFDGILAAMISSNATLAGNGIITGPVPLNFNPGSRLSPGIQQSRIGKMIFSNPPVLHGTTAIEISKNGLNRSNDQVQVVGLLNYGGSLLVSNLGPIALTLGDRFTLFGADSFTGVFSVVTLPPLPAGLNWANNLLVDGSIEVIEGPRFTGLNLSGTNLIFSGTGGISNSPFAVLTATNVAEPLSNWMSLATNLFGPSGGFYFTNAIVPDELQRYFRLRTP